MALYSLEDIVDRARVYVDDDHNAKSWIKDPAWVAIVKAEYAQLYKRWLRSGIIVPAISETTFTGDTATLTGVLAIIGVAEVVDSNHYRFVDAAQPRVGQDSTWSDLLPDGPSAEWTAIGSGDNLTVTLYPAPSNGTYIIRYIPVPTAPTSLASTLELPYTCDERLVLGVARRSHLKDSGASRLLDQLIFDADAELMFHAASKVNGPRVRTPQRRTSWPQCYEWRFY